jgi:hypothetical protein
MIPVPASELEPAVRKRQRCSALRTLAGIAARRSDRHDGSKELGKVERRPNNLLAFRLRAHAKCPDDKDTAFVCDLPYSQIPDEDGFIRPFFEDEVLTDKNGLSFVQRNNPVVRHVVPQGAGDGARDPPRAGTAARSGGSVDADGRRAISVA